MVINNLFYCKIKSEWMFLKRFTAQAAFVEEAVFAWLQFLGEGYLEGVVVNLVDFEINDVAV